MFSIINHVKPCIWDAWDVYLWLTRIYARTCVRNTVQRVPSVPHLPGHGFTRPTRPTRAIEQKNTRSIFTAAAGGLLAGKAKKL